MRRLVPLWVTGLILVLLGGTPAHAHPLGNFTINLFSRLEVSTTRVRIDQVVDYAEIPTFQLLRETPGRSRAKEGWLDRFAEKRTRAFMNRIELAADGHALRLAIESASAKLRRGQGGLQVLRVQSRYSARLPRVDARLHFENGNFRGRLGWKEVVADTEDGQGLARSSVPRSSVSNALRDYPDDMLQSPLDEWEADILLQPGAASAPGPTRRVDDAVGPSDLGERFTSILDDDLYPLFLALLVALGAGAIHALGPGHGKTIMAAYLVGAEGKLRHAITIGVAVSLMHTASVVALGLATLWAARFFPPEAVYPWLALLSGVVVVCLGGWLLYHRMHGRRIPIAGRRIEPCHALDEGRRHHTHGDESTSEHGHHAHTHEHHGHQHVPQLPGGLSPLSWKGLSAIAVSGGLLPSPTALVVLLGAVALHRVVYGIALVAAFSVGLAGALAVVGVFVLKARSIAASRLGSGAGTLLPVLSAAAIVLMGTYLTGRAVVAL